MLGPVPPSWLRARRVVLLGPVALLGLLLFLSGDPFVILLSLLLAVVVVATAVSGPRFPRLETHLACWILPTAVIAASWFVATTEPSVCFNCSGGWEHRAAIGAMAVYAFLGASLLASKPWPSRTPEAGAAKKVAAMLTGAGIGTSLLVLVVDGAFLLMWLYFSFVEFS